MRIVVDVWRDPWMEVGSGTFSGDVAARLGWVNCFATAPRRYPHVSVDDVIKAEPDLIVLPDEPYRFHAGDGPDAFPRIPSMLISGRLLTWYGPSLVIARELLRAAQPTAR